MKPGEGIRARSKTCQKAGGPEAKSEGGRKKTRRTPEEGPKRARSEACQKANRPEVRQARRPVGQKRGMPEGQQARSEAYQKARSKPRRQERQRPGDLTKERIGTEKFQQLEQKNSKKMLGIARCQIAHRKQPWLRKNITLCRKDHVDRKDCVNRKTNHANSKDHVARTVAKKSWSKKKEAVTGRKLISQ